MMQNTTELVSPTRLPMLDILRGGAALMIFLFHFFSMYPIDHAGVNDGLFWLVTGFFALGVPLFYALSGISLCIGYYAQRHEHGFAPRFYVRRFFRIAPLFYAAFIVWVAIYLSRGVWPDFLSMVTTLTFLSNLFPGRETTVVHAGWSVGVEMLFYLLFPLLIRLVCDLPKAISFFVVSLSISSVSFYVFWGLSSSPDYYSKCFMSHLMYFAAGILAYFLWTATLRWRLDNVSRVRYVVFWALAGGVISIWHITNVLVHDPASFPVRLFAHQAWSLPIMLLVLVACTVTFANPIIALLAKLGEWSFSMYLLHPIVLYFVFGWVGEGGGRGHSDAKVFYFWLVVSSVLLLVISFLTYHLIERPGMKLGRRLANAMKG